MKFCQRCSARLAIPMGILLLIACSGGGERGVSSQESPMAAEVNAVRGLEKEPLAVSYTLAATGSQARSGAKVSESFDSTNDILMALEKASQSDLSDAYEIVYVRANE